MADLSLAQIIGSNRDPAASMVADTLLKNDQFLGNLPLISTGPRALFTYDRKVANSTPAFIARDGSMSSNTGYTEVNIIGRTQRIYDQQGVDRSNANDAGGLARVKAKRAASSIAALGLTLGDKILTGAQTVTGTLLGAALTVANGFSVTAVGPNVIADRGPWLFKYTHSGTLVQVRAPGDPDYGAAVAIGTSTTADVYSYNQDQYVTVAHGSQAMSANDSGTIVISGGTNQFDGALELIKKQTARILYAGSAATDGAVLSLTDLDNIIEMVKGSARSDKRLIMGTRTWLSYQALVRAAAGALTYTDLAGAQVPAYNGVPILVTDFMPTTQTRGSTPTCTSVICSTFGEDGGLVGYYTPEQAEDEPNATVMLQGPMGVTVWDLGMSATAHNSTIRTVCHFAVGLPNTVKIAMLSGVTN